MSPFGQGVATRTLPQAGEVPPFRPVLRCDGPLLSWQAPEHLLAEGFIDDALSMQHALSLSLNLPCRVQHAVVHRWQWAAEAPASNFRLLCRGKHIVVLCGGPSLSLNLCRIPMNVL